MNWCILIPLLVGLLSALFGYLLGKSSSKGNDNSADVELWRNKNAQLEADLADCRSKLSTAETRSMASKSSNIASSSFATGAVSGVAFNAIAAKAAFGKNVKENDLTIVEGIGPKIQELFKDNNIRTWAALAGTKVSRLQEILDSKGERYRVHNPNSWPDQAKMAAEGRWAELKKWQDEHDYGKA